MIKKIEFGCAIEIASNLLDRTTMEVERLVGSDNVHFHFRLTSGEGDVAIYNVCMEAELLTEQLDDVLRAIANGVAEEYYYDNSLYNKFNNDDTINIGYLVDNPPCRCDIVGFDCGQDYEVFITMDQLNELRKLLEV